MPAGTDAFLRKQQANAQDKAAREAAKTIFTNDFKLRGGQYAVVRFLEQGESLTFADVHRVPIQGKNGQYFKNFICLDLLGDGTPCPACQHPNRDVAKAAARGFVNLIWREAPVWQRDENKRMIKGHDGNYIMTGREDQIALWSPSWTVFEVLKEKDGKYKGLMSRDFEIKRTGDGMNDTQWFVEPQDVDSGPQPMMISDLALAEHKYDLVAITKPIEYTAFAQLINKGAMPGGPQPTMDRSAVMGAPTVAGTFNGGNAEPQVRASAFQRG